LISSLYHVVPASGLFRTKGRRVSILSSLWLSRLHWRVEWDVGIRIAGMKRPGGV
jgi:hypothetical protein